MIYNKLEHFIFDPNEESTLGLREIFKLKVADCQHALECFKYLNDVPSIEGSAKVYDTFWDYLFHSKNHLNAFYNYLDFSRMIDINLPQLLEKTNFKDLFTSTYSYFDYSPPQNELIYRANEDKIVHYREKYLNNKKLNTDLFLYSKKLCRDLEAGQVLKWARLCTDSADSISRKGFTQLLEKVDDVVKKGLFNEKEIAFLYLTTLPEFKKMVHNLGLLNFNNSSNNKGFHSSIELYKDLGLKVNFDFFRHITNPEQNSHHFKKIWFELDMVMNAAMMDGIHKMYMSDTIMQEKEKLGLAIDEIESSKKSVSINKI